MAKNDLIKEKTAHDIDERVERVLRGSGIPSPRFVWRMFASFYEYRVFYTADDPSLIQEAVSRIRVATIQVFQRPMLLMDAIRKMSLQALYVPDRKRIFSTVRCLKKKHRWSEAHEVLHSLIPWHDDLMHGDNRYTLLPECHEQVEAERGEPRRRGRLLFLRDRFGAQAGDMPLSIASVRSLHSDFGNTISSTLWRFVETVGVRRPVVGMITCHPHQSQRPADFDPAKPCRHCIQSFAFAARFQPDNGAGPVQSPIFLLWCAVWGGPLGMADLVLTDDNGDEHVFHIREFLYQV